MANEQILFFDGHCGLCDRFVTWFLVRSHHTQIKCAPLQGSTGSSLFPKLDVQQLRTVLYQRHGKTFDRSTAVLYLLMDIGGLWRLAALGFMVPRFLRDAIYDTVAKNRFRFFGKRDACRLPTEEEKQRFLP